MRSSRRFRRLGAPGALDILLARRLLWRPPAADRPPAAGADRRLRRGTGGPTRVEPRFRIRAYPTADRYLRRSTLRIALSETTPDNLMRFYDTNIVAARRTWPSCHSAPDRTVVSVRRWAICRRNSCSPRSIRDSGYTRWRASPTGQSVSIPPGSRTCTSAPSVVWCTCRAPRQASSPRFWPGQR